ELCRYLRGGGDSVGSGTSEPVLQAPETGRRRAARRDDFGVQYHPVTAGCGFQRFGELGERIGQVFVVAADESRTVLVDDGHGSDAVPFHFEGPPAGRVVVVGDVGDVVDAAQGGQHRSDA